MTPAHRPSRRRTGVAGLALALAITAAACGGEGGGASITMTASASGGGPVDVTYVVDGERTTETVTSPWELTVDVDSRFDVDLTVLNPRDTGTVACGIGGDIRSLEADGPGGAECIVSGTAGNGSISSSGTSRSIERDPEATDDSADAPSEDATGETTPTDEEPVAERSGPTATIELLVDGEPTASPQQYDEVDLRVRVDGLDDHDDDIIVSTLSLFDDGETVRRVELTQFYDADDVESGSLIHQITERSGYSIARTGTYEVTVTGSVTIGDVDHPINEVVTFDVDEAPVETTIETFAGEAFSIELPSSWEIFDDQPFDLVVQNDFGGTADFIETASLIFGVRSLDSDAQLSVIRSDRPFAIGDLAAAEESYRRELGEIVVDTVTETVINGEAALRLEASTDEVALVAEIVRLDGEILLIQQRGVPDSPSLETMRAIRDSLVITPSAFPRLMHSVEIDLVAQGSDEPFGSFEVPADWAPAADAPADTGEFAFASPDGTLLVGLSSSAEDLDPDAIVQRVSEVAGADPSQVEYLDDPAFDRLAVVSTPVADGSGTVLTAVTSRSGRTITVTFVDRSGTDHLRLFGAMLSELVVN